VIRLPLQTKRLVIRPFEPERDAAALFELWGDEEAMRFVRPASASVEEVRERLEGILEWNRSGWGLWALDEREGGRLAGTVGLFPLAREGPEIELAYHVVQSRWGRGYATEAGAALLEAAWRETDLDHVVAIAFPQNRASTRVMEKLGMIHEGSARYLDHDFVRYSIARPRDLDHKETN
jgi:[ribosomal protein S5]-alanine N-acetyltransferase